MNLIPLLAISLLMTSPAWGFKCRSKVDSKRVVVFVNTNDAPAEIEGAAKAACERGEDFKVIPSKLEWVGQEKFQKEIEGLAAKNIAVTSMVVSGHDGGGKIHGDYGKINKHQIIESLKKAYDKKPDLLKEMKSVFMWGCWSMGPSEVAVWKTELPHIKLAAGFMDMGPTKDTLAVHTVLHGLLVKEKSLIAQADRKRLKRAIQGIPNINVTLPAIYADAACGDMYYYKTEGDPYSDPNPDDPFFKPGVHYLEYDQSFDCKKMADQIEEKRKDLIKYFYGEVPLPKDGPGSPIKGLYSFLRATAKCHTNPNHIMNGDRIFLLRFFEETKENFANVFSDVIGEANKEVVGLNEIMKASNDKNLKKYIGANHQKYFNPRYPTLKGKSRKDILEMISYLDGLVKQPVFKDSKYTSKVKHLRKLRNAMDIYLFQLHPRCMDMMDWHEVEPGVKPAANCPI